MRCISIFSLLVMLSNAEEEIGYRLPKNVIPYQYDIIIDVNMQHQLFYGFTHIQIEVLEETNRIIFHTLDLKYLDVHLYFNNREIAIASREFHNKLECFVMKFDHKLIPGKYDIKATYGANFRNETNGFYLSNQTHINKRSSLVAVTAFETMKARSAFPCFDEPAMKAHFNISIIRDKEYMSLSNMPLQETRKTIRGQYRDTFEMTPKMSTYLVTFAVGALANIPYNRGHIYTLPSNIKGANFAASIAESAITAVENYTEIPLPVKKLDMIAVRHTSSGGLENWGLILFSEFRLLYQEGVNQRTDKEDTLIVVVHEIVHQWFGDLVTPVWWNDLWLNEGISRYLHYVIGDQIMPEWRLRDQMALYGLRDAVEADYLDYARSISQKANEPNSYEEYFDTITYAKASMVLMTLENIIGKEILRKGLQHFLNKHKYSSATGEDLWNSFQEALDKANLTAILPKNLNLTTVMETWEHHAGVPVLNVVRTPSFIQFSQDRFLLRRSKNITAEWCIPINFATKLNPDFQNLTPIEWLPNSTQFNWTYHLEFDEWIIVNKEASFYYLVNYDDSNWELIASALNSDNCGNIPPLTRAKLLYDAFMLALSKRLKYSIALELTKYLRREKDYYVWNTFFYVFSYFYKSFSALDDFHYLQTFLADALEPILTDLGVEENKTLSPDQEHINTLNRVQIIKWACLLGNNLCRNLTSQRLNDTYSISVDLKCDLICSGFRGADVDLWTKLYIKSIENDDLAINQGLGCSENNDSLYMYIENELSVNISVFEKIYTRGSFGVNFVLDYLLENWSKIKWLPVDDTEDLIDGLSDYLSTDEQLYKLKRIALTSNSFRLKYHFALAIRKVEQTIEWVKFYSNDINYWITHKLATDGNPATLPSLYLLFIVQFLIVL